MKTLLSLFLMLTTVAAVMTHAAHHESETLRVMAFNIRYNNPNDGENAWPHRKDVVAQVIDSIHHADVVGLQEALREQIDDLEERLPAYEWFGVGRDDGESAGEHCAIFYKPERLELLDQGTFWLSETPDVPGSVSWDSAITRIVTWGIFKDKKTGKEFAFLNTHFDHRGVEARNESSKLILRKTPEIAGDRPTVLLGDFNRTEDTISYHYLVGIEPVEGTDVAYLDTRYLIGKPYQGPTATSTNWYEIRPDAKAIDHIFVRNGIKVHHFQTVVDTFDDRYPSDHLPVLADIELP